MSDIAKWRSCVIKSIFCISLATWSRDPAAFKDNREQILDLVTEITRAKYGYILGDLSETQLIEVEHDVVEEIYDHLQQM